jgi:isoamylase
VVREKLRSRDSRGQRIYDDSFVLMFNAHVEPVIFSTPAAPWSERWIIEFDSASETSFPPEGSTVAGATQLDRAGLSLMVLRRA